MFFLVLYLNCMLCVRNAKLPWLSLVLQVMGEKEVSGLSWVDRTWADLQCHPTGVDSKHAS